MGVATMTIDTAAVEAALFRSTGVKYEGMVYGPATNPAARTYTPTGKGRGHVYMHGADADNVSGRVGPGYKSRFQNHDTMVAVIVEVLNTPAGRQRLQWLDDNPAATAGLWLHGATGLTVTGAWYGYEQNGATLKRVIKTALNIRSFGDALFITSAYPEAFQVGLNPNAAAFVPGGGVV